MPEPRETKAEIEKERSARRKRLAELAGSAPAARTGSRSAKLELRPDSSELALMVVQDQRIVFVNDTVLGFLNCRRQDVVGRPIDDLLQTEEREVVVDRHHKRISGQEPLPSYSLRAVNRDGRIMLVELRAVRVDYEGRPAILCIFSDRAKQDLSREVMEAQRSIAALPKGEGTRSDSLEACLNIAVRISSSSGGTVFLQNGSGRMEPLTSHSVGQKLNRSLADALKDSDLAGALAQGDPYYPNGEDLGPRHLPTDRRDGEQTFLKALIPILSEEPAKSCLALVSQSDEGLGQTVREALEALTPLLQSIVKSIISEEADREHNNRFRTLVETMPDGLAIFDPRGRFSYANQTLARMLGLAVEEFAGRRGAEFMTPGNEPFFPEQGFGGENEQAEEYRAAWLRNDGSEIHTLNRVRPLRSARGEIKGSIAVVSDVTKSVESREALEKSEAKFRVAFDNAAVGMALVDHGGIYLEVNEAFCKMLGYAADELIGTSKNEYLLNPESGPGEYPGPLGPSPEPTQQAPQSIRMRRQNGDPLWAIQAGSLVRDPGGEPAYHIFYYIDISKQYLVDQALITTRERMNLIFRSLPLPGAIWRKGRKGLILIDFNSAMFELTQKALMESGQESPERIFTDRPDILKDLETCLETRSSCQRETEFVLDASGEVKNIHLTYTYMAPDGVLMICKDETPDRRAEAALRESEEHLRSLMEAARGFVIYRIKIDPDNGNNPTLVFVSPSAREVMGVIDPSDLDSWFEMVIPEDADKCKKAGKAGLPCAEFNDTLRVHHPAKGLRWLKVNSRILPAAQGKAVFINGLISDITDLKEAEVALREKEDELKAQATSLAESNIALRVLLQNIQQDKDTFQDTIIANVKKLVARGLESLVQSGLSRAQEAGVEAIMDSLDDVTSPFVKKLSADCLGLTKRELEVAKQVREGLSTSRIAESLGISINAVALHRKNVRAKLGIKSRKINLSVYLRNLSL